MNVFKKKDLVFKQGLLVHDETDRVVHINPVIVDLANMLEDKVQMYDYINNQPEARPAPSMDGYERKHLYKYSSDNNKCFNPKTPIIDKRQEDAVKFMDEIDLQHASDQANEFIKGLQELMIFVHEDEVVECGTGTLHRFDTPVLGNPLEWTDEDIAKAVAHIHGLSLDYEVEKDSSEDEE